MTYSEAVEVLGFREGDVISPHLPAFRKAEGKLVELIENAGNEGLRSAYLQELAVLNGALRVVEVEQSRQPVRRRTGSLVMLVLSLLVLGGVIYSGWRANQWAMEGRQVRLEQRVQMLAATGQIAVEKRRWPEAEAVYSEILALMPESPRGGDGVKAIEAGKEEERRQLLGFLSGTARAAIDARSWGSAEETLKEILKLDPENTEVAEFRKRIENGRFNDKVMTIREAAEEAIRDERWGDLVGRADELAKLAPGHVDLPRLKKLSEDGIRLMEERRIQARQIYQKALAMDEGKYSEEVLDLLRDALRLSREKEYEALYEKMSSYTRTLRVPEDYKTIAAAIADARGQDKVRVGEGIFEESLSVPAGVDLEGAGPGKTIIQSVAGEASAILIEAEAKGIRLASLSVRFEGISVDEERFPVIAVDGGEVVLEDVWVENGSGHGIAVINGGKAAMQSVRVIKSGWDGLAVYGESSKVTIIESRFDQNLHHGVDAWNGGSVTVRKSRFSNNGLAGVVLMSVGVLSRVETSVSEGNRELGILVAQQTSAELVGNEVLGNLLGGIVVKDAKTRVEIANNTVTRNKKAGIMVDRNATMIRFENNRVSGNDGVQEDLKAELGESKER